MSALVALPVFNEVAHARVVIEQVQQYAADILVADDGSTDGTSDVLSMMSGIRVVRHTMNQGYGASLALSQSHCRESRTCPEQRAARVQ
jgi:glycosyltransferase involved in cell wall biosynthesis